MKEHPILFSTEMVQAILDNSKTQTRRVIKPQPIITSSGCWIQGLHYANEHHLRRGLPIDCCPYGQPGDCLWVREAWRPIDDDIPVSKLGPGDDIYYRTDYVGEALNGKWRPSIHMPRWASRITLEVVKVRLEHIQDIGNDNQINDVFEEGLRKSNYYEYADDEVCDLDVATAVEVYKKIWDSINAHRGYSWESNPWVWVIEFRKALIAPPHYCLQLHCPQENPNQE